MPSIGEVMVYWSTRSSSTDSRPCTWRRSVSDFSCAWVVTAPRPISSVVRATSRLAKSSRAFSSCNCARISLSSRRASTSPRFTGLFSQPQMSTMRWRTRLVTFAQRTGSTAPVA